MLVSNFYLQRRGLFGLRDLRDGELISLSTKVRDRLEREKTPVRAFMDGDNICVQGEYDPSKVFSELTDRGYVLTRTKIKRE